MGDVVINRFGAMDVNATYRNQIDGYMTQKDKEGNVGVEWVREWGRPSAMDIAERHGYLVVPLGSGEFIYVRPGAPIPEGKP